MCLLRWLFLTEQYTYSGTGLFTRDGRKSNNIWKHTLIFLLKLRSLLFFLEWMLMIMVDDTTDIAIITSDTQKYWPEQKHQKYQNCCQCVWLWNTTKKQIINGFDCGIPLKSKLSIVLTVKYNKKANHQWFWLEIQLKAKWSMALTVQHN